MNQIDQNREELKAAVLELVNTESKSITPSSFFVLTGFIDYTFALEQELRQQGEIIRQLQGNKKHTEGDSPPV